MYAVVCSMNIVCIFDREEVFSQTHVACYAVTPYKIRQDKQHFNSQNSLFVETLEGIFVPLQHVLQTKNYISLDASI